MEDYTSDYTISSNKPPGGKHLQYNTRLPLLIYDVKAGVANFYPEDHNALHFLPWETYCCDFTTVSEELFSIYIYFSHESSKYCGSLSDF